MPEQQMIKCAFCQGTGNHPHYSGNCPVCKGKGKNKLVGKYMTCADCGGSGQKGGTTLTCYYCGGLGVVADTKEEFDQARREIKQTREEITKETGGNPSSGDPPKQNPAQNSSGNSKLFCQCCAKKVSHDLVMKVCLDCLRGMKQK